MDPVAFVASSMCLCYSKGLAPFVAACHTQMLIARAKRISFSFFPLRFNEENEPGEWMVRLKLIFINDESQATGLVGAAEICFRLVILLLLVPSVSAAFKGNSSGFSFLKLSNQRTGHSCPQIIS